MDYKKAKIYFLSGTGNSYRVAAWLHEACIDRGTTSEIIPIDLAKPKEEIEASPENLIVLAYPTHGFLPPWSAVKFIFKMPFKRRAHFFCIPTRGCLRFGPIIIPGIAALASLLPVFVLPFKGYNIRGSLSFDMPSNVTFLHSRLSDKISIASKPAQNERPINIFPNYSVESRYGLPGITSGNIPGLCLCLCFTLFFRSLTLYSAGSSWGKCCSPTTTASGADCVQNLAQTARSE